MFWWTFNMVGWEHQYDAFTVSVTRIVRYWIWVIIVVAYAYSYTLYSETAWNSYTFVSGLHNIVFGHPKTYLFVSSEQTSVGKLGQDVVYFDQWTHAWACVCMFENNEKHLKIMKKVPFPSCVLEAHVRLVKKNEEKSLLVSYWEWLPKAVEFGHIFVSPFSGDF